ncbi:MAG: hypothetical protein ACQEW5_23295 [Bacillota bacterium]
MALKEALKDEDPEIVELARLALRRTKLLGKFTKRLHITITDQPLASEPKYQSPSDLVPTGTEIITLRWNIPSAINEEGLWGGLLFYDQVQILNSGKVGYIPRFAHNEIGLI